MSALTDTLQTVQLFRCLSQRQLNALGRDFRERSFKPGAAVVRQGQMSGVGFFIITQGEATVDVDGKEVARLGPGDHFGELALITEGPRVATVTAETPLECLEISFWDFRRFAKSTPDITWRLLKHVAGLLIEERSAGSSGKRR